MKTPAHARATKSGNSTKANRAASAAAPWWAEGDFPVRQGVVGQPLIDGRAAMLAMCRAFLSAQRFILLAAWDIRADLQMVRGEDAHVGDDGSPEQNALIAGLRKDGLSEEAIALWNAGRLQVRDVLGFVTKFLTMAGGPPPRERVVRKRPPRARRG